MIASIHQKKIFFRRQSIEITDDYILTIEVSSLTNTEKFNMPLAGFDSTPAHLRQVNLKPLILALPLALLGIGSLIGTFYALGTGMEWQGYLGLAVFFLLLAGLFSAPMITQSYNILRFSDPAGRTLVVWFDNPNSKDFDIFTGILRVAIDKARDIPAKAALSLTSEIEKLKSMLDRGIIDEKQYESGKNKLLGLESDRRVGF